MILGSRALSFATLCLCILLGAALTPEQHKGKQIFLTGTSARGDEITARIGADNSSVPAAILPCASCHGRNGRGRAEGGVAPSNITWEVLTKPYAITSAAGRQRSPYTDALLKRAIVMGVDSSGNPLQTTMPRFQLKITDLSDLVAYLHVLGTETDPGIADSELRLGVVLAAGNQFAETRAAVRSVLEAWLKDVNDRGGIFGRKLALRFLEPPEEGAARMAALRKFIDSEDIFALLASNLAGVEHESADLVSEREVPVVGALALYPQIAAPLNRYVFYLQPGLSEQARALVIFAHQQLDHAPSHVTIIGERDPRSISVTAAVQAECNKLGWKSVESVNPAAVTPDRRQTGNDLVLVLAPGILSKVVELDARSSQKAQYLVPASLVDLDLSTLPEELRSHISVAYPTLLSDGTSDGVSYFRKLMSDSSQATHHLAAQWTALASARLLTYALEKAGRDLSREQLIEILERTYQFPTGLSPTLSFGPNRRIGSTGVHIVQANHLDQPGKWIDP
ncbi:MAG TPA: ABC transporter substrate-binding protein [Candidatus Angelobacter sp.]|jgi:ABC-type branched-subunit amino acid transport system substrate-binding protein|nr:ABC transporter substrate-binding protein [Candidatus Angelobacter sp.]